MNSSVATAPANHTLNTDSRKTNLHIGPIFRALMRNKIGAILIAVQIAFTMTVVVNAWFMVSDRLGLIDRPSGLLEADLFYLTSTATNDKYNVKVSVDDDLRLLRNTPGVIDAVQINAIPLSGSGWSMGLRIEAGEDTQSWPVAVYMVDEHGIATLGVELIAGANFDMTDVLWRTPAASEWPNKVIITKTMAEKMFAEKFSVAGADPKQVLDSILGTTVYISNDQPTNIVGIIDKLQAPWSSWNDLEHSMLVPQKMEFKSTQYMIRTQAGQRDVLMPTIEDNLAQANSQRIIRDMLSMHETRERSYRLDGGLATILIVIMVVLIVITAVGVAGLASFSVKRRTKQIGTRRALGANQADILRFFQTENLMITGFGVVLGAAMTIGLNIVLVEAMSFPKVHWLAIPIGMLALIAVGQISVLGPARRACRVSPAVATRTI